MVDRKKGIDLFRLIAAVMVIGIHTFPFSSLSTQADELLTLTVFRVAVPFFFMTTGYFLIGKLSTAFCYLEITRVKAFLKKMSLIYAGVILLYLPFSILVGYVSLEMSVGEFVKTLLFEGTFYHLWYFPSLIIGLILVVSLLRLVNFQTVFLISIALYLIGLGGDSWYYMIQQSETLASFYDMIFSVMSMTRTGLFFTPLFLCLGALIYREKRKFSPRLLIGGGFFFLVAMLIESRVLHEVFGVKHDSMYLFLPGVMYCLFLLLLQWQPRIEVKQASQLSLWVYILHPLVIVVVHFFAKGVAVLTNSFIYFLCVVVGSFLLGRLALKINDYRQKRPENKCPDKRATRELSESSLRHNVAEIKRVIPAKTQVMAVVKANAYGTDMVTYAKLLQKQSVTFFAVATIDEGIALRKALISGDILVLGYTDPRRVKELQYYDLTQSIVSEEHGRLLNNQKIKIRCHIQVDTGMHRLGLVPDIVDISRLYRLPYLRVEGIYSHLGSSDSLETEAVIRTEKQLQMYCRILHELKKLGIDYGVTHIQSSYGILNYPEYSFDYVRAGIILYGYLSHKGPVKTTLELRPVMEIKAKLISKRYVQAGDFVGYGTDTKLTKRTLVGVVSIGYADGISRSLSKEGFQVSYQGNTLPLIGSICMDMLLIDLGNVPTISVGEEVVVLDDFEEVALMSHTITNETLSQLGRRLVTDVVK